MNPNHAIDFVYPRWLGRLPKLPLKRGVPVWVREGRAWFSAVVISIDSDDDTALAIVGDDPNEHIEPIAINELRVDLDDPEGFIYAIRLVWQDAREGKLGLLDDWSEFGTEPALLERHLNGETTDDDRLELAQVCADFWNERS